MAMNQKRRAGEKKALQKAKENYAEEKCIVDFEWTGEFVKDGHLCESVQVNSTLKHSVLFDNLSILPTNSNPWWNCVQIQVSLDAGEPFGVILVKVDMYGNYPVRPPTMTILSKVHHPNVYKDGRVCMRFQTKYILSDVNVAIQPN